ncbi:protein similar isoform X2 [Anthonomus grandis grandis]|uniref:protein similar isoform X2 n=1 Tax=Anthonomus grandis grandis TaxID=2921223 RepID=UPI0021663C6E|nr:protein similar isoform X2 [Anthonomus grandis grandis]
METKSKAPKEKRRNNEKRKEKSRDAARSRRSRETEIFADLGTALPIAPDQVGQLDKASVMRLAISFLRVRDMIGLIPVLPVKEKLPKHLKEEPIFLKSLDGFLVVISSEGDFVYLSENVSDYLGIAQIDLMGQNVFEYSHPCDHEEIKDILASKSGSDVPKSFFIRLKCTLTSKGRSVNLKSATFKVIHCTGHIIKDKSISEEESKGRISSCLVAIGQPIPHPSNIDTPLPRQTFLTKHSLDMKFTHADDEFMLDVLGYTSEDLLGQSVYEYHHAMDSDAIGAAYKCLFSKGQCETNRYRFLAKTGGFVWVVTQATLIYDKMQKPQSVVCVNYVISGVECKDEIYAAHQLVHAKPIIATKSVIINSADPPVILVEDTTISTKTPVVNDSNNNSSKKITEKVVVSSKSDIKKSVSRPISVTAKFFGGYAPPPPHKGAHQEASVGGTRRTTDTIFAPKTEDMNQGFLILSEEEPGATMLKEDPEDLNCLAPAAGDACIPLDDQLPIYSDMFLDDILLKDNSLGSFLGAEDPSDPYMSYREYRDSSPQLLSPNNMSKSSDCSIPSLCSPNSSLLDEEMSTFMSLQVEDETDLVMKAPYIPMNLSDDLPLLGDLMWNQNEKNHHGGGSTLAQMLGTNGASKRTGKCTDRGGGGGGGGGRGRGMIMMEDSRTEMYDDSEKNLPIRSSWSTKLSPKLEMDSVGQMDRSPSVALKRSHAGNQQHNQTATSNNFDHNHHQSKRIKSEPKEKMSSELFHQLISNNHQRGGGGGGRPGRNKSDWLRDTGGKAACISQPSESVLMNLLENTPPDSPSPPPLLDNETQKMEIEMDLTTPLFAAKKRMLQQREKQKQVEESRRNLIRKNSLSLLDPEATSVASLLDLTQQDCEVNAPVNSSSLLQGEELLKALEVAQLM